MSLLSHPHLTLKEHLEQVIEAISWLIKKHSPQIWEQAPELLAILERTGRAHDIGKASHAFQKYIVRPEKYHGDPLEKAHSPISLLFTLYLSQKEKMSFQESLMAAAAVAGHHSGMPTREDLSRMLMDSIPTSIWKCIYSGFPIIQSEQATGLFLDMTSLDDSLRFDMVDYLEYELFETLDELSIDESLTLRLKSQLVLSILLEADKTFLAVAPQHLTRLKQSPSIKLYPSIVDSYLTQKPPSKLNELRTGLRKQILENLQNSRPADIYTITLPTGMGKTMTAASWALTLRESLLKENYCVPKIIVVMPYLSIIDQVEKEYQALLGNQATHDMLLSMHSLSDRVFDSETDGNTNDFFVDTWQSPFIITTFDQFLLAAIGPKSRHLIRYHNLCDALIIMDEVQTLPCRLWDPISQIFKKIAEIGNSHFLVMSATQPGFFSNAIELVSNPPAEFEKFARYRLVLNHQKSLLLEDFIAEVCNRLSEWQNERVLITLNTRRSARAVRDAIKKKYSGPLFFISADVTPLDRLEAIKEIKKNYPCIVVSTQCIEAGVDIDMDRVIRDFAPFDPIIQIAGRCNRNNARPRCDVEIVSLINEKHQRFSEMVYDPVLLQETQAILSNRTIILEEEVYKICTEYFANLAMKKDIGKDITKRFAYWHDIPPVNELLRGKERKKYDFIVADEAPGLVEKIKFALKIDDRWERRRALRAIAGEISKVTVSVWATPKFCPDDVAMPISGSHFWVLEGRFYDKARGLLFSENQNESAGSLIF